MDLPGTPKVLFWLFILFLAPSGQGLRASDDSVDPDEAMLREAKVDTSDSGLVDFLREEAGANLKPDEIKNLIRQLANENLEDREEAGKKLIAVGFPAIALLRRALTDDNAEIARRARTCLDMIDGRLALPGAAVRLVARRKPAGAVKALLGYLPKVPDENAEEDVWYCLGAVAVRDGKVDPALAAALEDAAPQRRAVAACILGRFGDAEQRGAARNTLKDPDPDVRLRAAQGLLAAKDKVGIPCLVDMLEAGSTAVSWQAEELLHWMAGGKGPNVTVGSGTSERKKECRKAWETWWREREDKIDAADFGKGCNRPGLMLVSGFETVSGGANSEIRSLLHLYGCDGRRRWQLDDAPPIWDFQPLPGPRLLLVEGKRGERVTERDLQGKVSWKKEYDAKVHPVTCQRLSNGNTFILGSARLFEVDGEGKDVYHLEEWPNDSLPVRARKLENGHILCVTVEGLMKELDTAGKELRSSKVEIPIPDPSHAVILNDGHVLMPAEDREEIVEVNAFGRKVRSYKWPGFQHAVRLRNGHTLVAGRSAGTIRVFEIDRAGKKIHETDCAGGPHQIRVCLGLVRFGFDDIESSTP
jgi:hypothetical protein